MKKERMGLIFVVRAEEGVQREQKVRSTHRQRFEIPTVTKTVRESEKTNFRSKTRQKYGVVKGTKTKHTLNKKKKDCWRLKSSICKNFRKD